MTQESLRRITMNGRGWEWGGQRKDSRSIKQPRALECSYKTSLYRSPFLRFSTHSWPVYMKSTTWGTEENILIDARNTSEHTISTTKLPHQKNADIKGLGANSFRGTLVFIDYDLVISEPPDSLTRETSELYQSGSRRDGDVQPCSIPKADFWCWGKRVMAKSETSSLQSRTVSAREGTCDEPCRLQSS